MQMLSAEKTFGAYVCVHMCQTEVFLTVHKHDA